MEQKKKILLMVGVLGLLLVGFIVYSFVFNSSPKTVVNNTPVTPAAPGPTNGHPGGLPIAGKPVLPNMGKPGIPNIAKPGMPNMPKPGMPVVGKPGVPNMVKPGMPIAGKPATPSKPATPAKPVAPAKPPVSHPAPPAKAPIAPAGVASHPTTPAGASGARASVIPSFSDPFKGIPRKPKPKKPVYYGPKPANGGQAVPEVPAVIPVVPVPGVNTQPADGGVKYFDDEGAVPTTKQNQFAFDLGRSAGWIAGNANGKVTAYFEARDGSVVILNVGSEISGFRVKAINIDKQYLLLVNMRSGAEQKIRMSGERRAPTR